MPRQEELEIALRDSITPGLKAIARELRDLNKAAKESAAGTAQEIDKVTDSTKRLAEATKAAGRGVENMFGTIVGYGKTILGVGGTYEAITKLTESLGELATSRVQLSMFAQDTRMSVEGIDRMKGAMERMGLSSQQAQQYIGTLSNKLQELQALRQGSTLFRELQAMGATKFATQLMDEKDLEKQKDMLVDFFKKQTPEVQYYLAQMLGVPQSVMLNLKEYEKKVGETIHVTEEVAKQYLENSIKLRDRVDTEWTLFANHAMEGINKWYDKIQEATGKGKETHPVSDFLISEFDGIEKGIQSTVNEVKVFVGWLDKIKEWANWMYEKVNPSAKADDAATGKAAGSRLDQSFKDLDQLQQAQESNKLLNEIRDSLMRMESGGAGGGAGVRSEGAVSGPMQAGGGGFRPAGGVRGARAGAEAAAAVRARGGTEAEADAAARAANPAGPATATEVSGRQFGTLAQQRAPYKEWLDAHPDEKAKLAALLVSEEPSREGRVGTAETFLNRMISHGVKPEQMASSIEGLRSGPGVYYEPLRPGGTYGQSAQRLATDAELKAQTLADIDKALGGSDVSNLGTQNASAGVAANAAQTSTVTRQAIKGISDQWSRKDRPEWASLHGAGTTQKEADWYSKTSKAMRDNVDGANNKGSVFDKGTASVTVDFGDQKRRNAESQEGGKVFKDLKMERAPQSPKAGSESGDFKDRWVFQ